MGVRKIRQREEKPVAVLTVHEREELSGAKQAIDNADRQLTAAYVREERVWQRIRESYKLEHRGMYVDKYTGEVFYGWEKPKK